MAWSVARPACASRASSATTGDTALLDYHLAAMRDLGAPPLLTGNGVELLIDGPRTYRAMFAALEKARSYILIESFIFEEAVEGDRKLSLLLQQAAARGVRIFVIYDAIGSLTTEKEFLAELQQAEVALCVFNPLNPLDDRFAGLNQRDHRKIVVVDGVESFAGGVNFSHAYRIASNAGQARRFLEAGGPRRGLARHAHRLARHRGQGTREAVSRHLVARPVRGEAAAICGSGRARRRHAGADRREHAGG